MRSTPGNNVVEFYYDISCPFAYIASTRIEALAARTVAHLIWRPVLLGAIYRATSAPQGAAGSASDVFNPTKKRITSSAFRRTINRYGIEHNEPPKHPMKTTGALRLLYSVGGEQRPKLSKALFRAYWVEGKDVSDRDVLLDVVKRTGVPAADDIVKSIEDGSFEGQKERRELENATDLAVQRGTPGVPAFWVPNEIWTDKQGKRRQGRLYWGQDRMHFVEAVLLAMNEGKNGYSLGSISASLQSLVPRCARDKSIPGAEEVRLEFWYDFSSPWAFLGWTQLKRLQRQFGTKLQIEMKPFLLGILFREIGAPNTPMTTVSEQKRIYSQLDHQDWCRWWSAVNEQEGKPDKEIEFYWADIFPIRTPTVLRAVLVEPSLAAPLFRACWERNLNMSADDILSQVIAEAGYDAPGILARANSDKYKKALRARTQEAKQIGLCGVPSYRVFRRRDGQDWKQVGDVVWGQDEMPVVEDLIVGWNGEGVADVSRAVDAKSGSKL